MRYTKDESSKEEKAEKGALRAPCCEGCTKWEQFGDKCWVFWERKKVCSQHSDNDIF